MNEQVVAATGVIETLSSETITTQMASSVTSDAEYTAKVTVRASSTTSSSSEATSLSLDSAFHMNFEMDIETSSMENIQTAIETVLKASSGRLHIEKPGPWFNIKMSSYQYRKSHCGDKTVVRSSYLHNGISYTGKTTSLYWIRAQIVMMPTLTSLAALDFVFMTT